MAVVLRLCRASALLLISIPFVFSVFQFPDRAFWTNGLGDWLDPYFINYLLEHWHHSVWSLSSPASPPMYFPASRTLGYSHGLVLYVPFYLLVRPFLHPFQAYSFTLLLVFETGIVCLYLLFRKVLALSFVESLVLTAFFFTSRNVVNEFVGVWSQRASVFLVPPILLLVLGSARLSASRLRMFCAGLAGVLSTLMFTQDFYTAAFALLFVILALVPAVILATPYARRLATRTWKAESSMAVRIAIVVVALVMTWTLFVVLTGGVSAKILGVRIISRDWRRPAMLAVAAMAAVAWLRGGINTRPLFARAEAWWLPFISGAALGGMVFLWIYAGAYSEHPRFPADQLMASLVHREPLRWQRPLEIVRNLGGYETLRTFKLVFVLGILGLLPWFKVERRIRWYCLWALVVSSAVLIVPLTFGGFSIWKVAFAPLPGLSVVRDPKRIAYVYELAAVIAVGVFLARLPWRSTLRIAAGVIVFALAITERNRTVFEFVRPNETYDRWVAAPIEINSSCRSFFIIPASTDYSSRWRDISTVYSVDAMFVSLEYSIPTLNGYSAWAPEGWRLGNPQIAGYGDAVREWIARNQLSGVCRLDIDHRVMMPGPGSY
jgi:hypothetical protein